MPIRTEFSPGEFCWIDLNAHDLESAAAWYSALFGWTHAMMETPDGAPQYAFFERGDAAVGGLGQMSDEMKAMGIPPMWNSYVCVADCEATEAKVQELGAAVTVPTMEIPGQGKLAFFTDPEGASFAAWQKLGESGTGVLVGEPGGLSWTELMTRDVEKASSFYGKLVGWEFATMPMGDIEYTLIKNKGKDVGGLFSLNGPQFEGVPAHWMVYIQVEDCEGTAAKAQASGGSVMVPPTEIPMGQFSVLRDLQGGVFSVIQLSGADC